MFSNTDIQKMYDRFSSLPWFWEIDAIVKAVKPGGRIALIGFKLSSQPFFQWFNRLFKWMSIPFGGVDLDRDVRNIIGCHCREIAYEEVFGGFYYILVTEKPRPAG